MKLKNLFKKNNENYIAIFLLISCLLLLISIIYPLIIHWYFKDWAISGTFGDTFGGLNSVFSTIALAGVITTILMQRKELTYQREEMQETRKEFLTNRITNLIYNQLNRFENNINNLNINFQGTNYVGNDAIIFLYHNLYNTYINDVNLNREKKKKYTIQKLEILTPNISEINKFSHIAYNSVKVLKELIFSTDLHADELNNLKRIFFVNVGYINIEVIRHFANIQDDEFELLEGEDYVNLHLKPGTFATANIFLKFVVDFYSLQISEENIGELRNEWLNK